MPVARTSPLLAYSSRAFIVAILLFSLMNLLLLSTDFAGQKRNPAEVLTQARQERQAGLASKHSWSWWLTKLYEEQSQAPEVVAFGSSLLGSAHASIDADIMMQLIDVLTHRRMVFLEDQLSSRIGHKVSVFSLGSPGEMISDFYAISKALFVAGRKPKLVIATISPRDFIDSTLAYPAATDHYKFFSNYADLANMNKFAYPDFFSRLGAEMDRLPLKRLSKLAITDHAENIKTDWNQSESCRTEPGKSVVPAMAVPRQVDNTKEYQERFRQPFGPNYACELQFFRRFLADMKKQGISVTVVCMPTTKSNRQLLSEAFWQRFRRDVSAACHSNKADWLDLSEAELFQPSDYLDTVHLNAYGAYRLFPAIADHVSKTPESVSALKPITGGAGATGKSGQH